MKQTKKRIKTVFNNDQCCHVWASQTQKHGRNSNNSIYFHGTEIFSYGRHYLLAKIYPEFNNVVLINSDNYSPTTGKHQWSVYSSVKHLKSFRVPHPDNPIESIKIMGDALIERLYDVFSQLKPYITLDGYFDEYNQLCEAFNRKDLKLEIPQDLKDLLNEHLSYREQRNLELDKKRELKRRRAAIMRERQKRIDKYKIDIEISQDEIKNKFKEKQDIKDWLTGKSIPHIYHDLDLIRVKGNKVETTGGAEVPLNQAIQLMKAIDAGLDVVGQRVGHFTVDAIELVNNRIEIGCHTIPIGQARQVLKTHLDRLR